jgi:uncharacterized protein
VTVRRDGEDLLLRCRVQPAARPDAFVGVRNGELLVRLGAPAVDGRANDALRRFVARSFAVPPSRVLIERGQSSRHKILRIVGVSGLPAAISQLT